MILNLTELSNEPMDEQITMQLLRRILAGDLRAGDLLVPARTLASRQRVGMSTVRRAYEALAKRGVVRRLAGDRYVVATLSPEAEEKIRHRLSQKDAGGRAGMQEILSHDGFDVDADEGRWMEADMATARQIQADLLPKELPDEPGLRVAAYCKPSLTVGGDFYDVIALDQDRIAIVIADASGKGLPAAMMISQLHGMFRSEINHGNDISITLRHVNDHLAAFSSPEKFATVFIGIFDRSTGEFEYANAGHNHPVLMRADGTSEPLEAGGTILGIFPGADFVTETVVLDAGDLLFLYTDGVTETRNATDEEYGEDRLLDLLRRHRERPADGVVETVLRDLGGFQATEPLQDDRTCLVLKSEAVAARLY
ncbi:MAG: SpoIIE family protein phosphatase [Candidatus Krumholzibacteria bacterium]|nr:SpoIIE family protein phosphatase [Candidatus Krumholzibacteria bacterium]